MNTEQQIQIYSEAIEEAQNGNYIKALGIIDKISKHDRGYAFYFYRGFFTQQQDLRKYSSIALEDYMKAYEINPNTYNINDIIGSSYLYIEKYGQAIPFLEKAYELYLLESEAPPPYWALAEVYLNVGRFEDAILMNDKAIEYKEDPWYYLQRGIILSQNGGFQILSDNYKIAKAIETDYISSLKLKREYALRLIQMDYTEKAFQLYSKWLIGNENYFDWCYADMGYILMLNGDWDNSIVMLKKAESINNTSNSTLQYLSFYYFFKEDYDKAYSYEAQARLQFEPSGLTFWKESIDEFYESYKENSQFQILLSQNPVASEN